VLDINRPVHSPLFVVVVPGFKALIFSTLQQNYIGIAFKKKSNQTPSVVKITDKRAALYFCYLIT